MASIFSSLFCLSISPSILEQIAALATHTQKIERGNPSRESLLVQTEWEKEQNFEPRAVKHEFGNDFRRSVIFLPLLRLLLVDAMWGDALAVAGVGRMGCAARYGRGSDRGHVEGF